MTAAGTVIHGLRSRSAHTENAKRPPGRSTRRISPSAGGGSPFST